MKKPVRRRYDTRRIRRGYSYSINEIADLFTLHKNAVRNWLREGLPTIDRQKPYLMGFLKRLSGLLFHEGSKS